VPLSGKRLLIVEDDQELARLMGAAAERLGARVSLCASGEEALAALQVWPADAAVIDLPLGSGDPRELLDLLRRRGVPAAAVSGVYRGARGAEDVHRLGVGLFFEKPFQVEELLGAVGRTLHAAAAAAPAPAAPAPDERDVLAEELRDFDSLIFSQARPALDEVVIRPLRAPEVEGLARPLPGTEPPAARREESAVLPAGDLARAGLPRLLTVLHTGRATGALSLRRGEEKRLLLLSGGAPVFGTSNLPQERFGALCVREGILRPAALTALLRALRPGDTTAGALLARELLTPERRAELVAMQVAEIAWGAFAWREGTYRITLGPLPARELVPIDLFPGELILEGMRRAATLPQLREALPPEVALAPAADPAFELHRLQLRSREAELLAHADGTKRVADLVALSGLPEREALAFLEACRAMGLLDTVERVLASTRRIGFM